MKRLITTAAAMISAALLVASFAAPASAKPAKPPQAKDLAAQQCAAAKKADKAAFDSLYGKHAMRNCIKAQTGTSQTELKNAAKQCKAEQAADPTGFETTYGDPYSNSNNAFGKCVSTKVKAGDAADTTDFQNAAKECKAERRADPNAFTVTYGTGKNGRNALGKCVSQKVKTAETTPSA